MSIKDTLIMEVPFGALKAVVREKGIETKLTSLEEVATAISDDSTDIALQLANEFKFAGNTAINLNIMMSGITAEWHNKQFFKAKFKSKFSTAVFTNGLRPQLSEKPQLIRAYEYGERIVLAFSFLGKHRRYLENFEIVSRRQQIVEYVVIHFSPFSIEVRASQEQNKLFRNSVLELMDVVPEDVVWDLATKLNEQQAKNLAIRLNAKLRSAKHKMIEGVYATKEVTANTQVDDLESTEEYRNEFVNQPMKRATLNFDFKYSFGYTEAVSYVITDSGLWVRSKSGEEVFSYILEQIIIIKYPSDEEDYDDMDFEEVLELEPPYEEIGIEIELAKDEVAFSDNEDS